jgi:MoxR-like ATPase
MAPELARQAVEMVHELRELDLKKSPSISETLDWARALVKLNADQLDSETVDNTLSVLLKHEADLFRARRAMGRAGEEEWTQRSDLDRRPPRRRRY